MTDLRLDYDEGILLQGDGGYRSSDTEDEVSEMVLTTKNLICVIERSTGLFKTQTDVVKIPLSSIRVVNGQPQVAQMNHPEHGIGMQILYANGKREHYSFYGGTGAQKKEITKWVGAITQAITGTVPDDVSVQSAKSSKPKANPVAFTGFGAISSGLQSVVDTAKQTIEDTTKQFSGAVYTRVVDPLVDSSVNAEPETSIMPPPVPEGNSAPVVQTQHFFCSNCGQKLNAGVRFCHSCGNSVNAPVPPASATTPPPVPPVPPVSVPKSPEPPKPRRQQEYVGTVLKCPNCGAVVGETTVICPDCGIRITRRNAVDSVQEFKDQLMAIEATRKKGLGGVFGVYTAPDPADTKKLSLIRNFPIPNSVDDIMEFMFLAVANIDVALSKNTMMNKLNNTQQVETGATIGRTISNAWVSKMQQAYQKAEIMFPSDPAFSGIKRLYFEKIKELKIKI